MEEELRDLLLATSAISALAANRIDWVASAQGTSGPRIVLRLISGAEGATLTGSDGLLQASVQADVFATSKKQATDLARAVVARLHGYSGGGFRAVFHVATRDGREGTSNEADRPFRVSLDFNLTWRRA